MKIYICDDEIEIVNQIKRFLMELNCDFDVEVFTNVIELQKEIKKNTIDILFMDIKLESVNGIEFIKKNEEILKNTKVVYITGYSEYFEDIFETNPIYFLQKPITIEKIKKVITKVNRLNEKENFYIVINVGKKIEKVYFENILFIESYSRVLHVHLTNGKILKTYNKLSEIIKKLPSTFIKIHKSYIINLDQVINYKANRVILSNDEVLPISRLNKEYAKNEIMKYISN